MPTLDESYAAAVAAVRARVLEYATGLFGPDAISDSGVAGFVSQLLPVVAAGQQQTAALTDAYLTQVLAAEFDERIVSDRVIDTSQGLRGVDMSTVYARPTKTVRFELTQGKEVADAVAAGSKRLTKMVQSDMQLAKTTQARATMRRSMIDGYQRVLNGPHNCAKCIVASTRFYHKEQLMPIHPGCDCGVKPARTPRGVAVLHEDRLNAIHDQVDTSGLLPANPSATDYQNLLVVHEHGELGPVMSLRGEHFRTRSNLPKAVRPPKETKADVAQRLLPGLEGSLSNLRAKGLAEDSPQIAYHLAQISRLRADLAA
ncbi:hypothetical protein [Mycobacterium sp. CnD-18-1]|uniref:hypothetical protein n=1 Tax=Mycobacterium sp. CnD-18-1 TaxID=2917744 RepID=UPI001EF32DCA|nr:hypothetical protein [Mycobacterium sp. CnD-18-1]MCG7610351.1 hypothetical protein [Mycobacterium sp. CnD-18-1]